MALHCNKKAELLGSRDLPVPPQQQHATPSQPLLPGVLDAGAKGAAPLPKCDDDGVVTNACWRDYEPKRVFDDLPKAPWVQVGDNDLLPMCNNNNINDNKKPIVNSSSTSIKNYYYLVIFIIIAAPLMYWWWSKK